MGRVAPAGKDECGDRDPGAGPHHLHLRERRIGIACTLHHEQRHPDAGDLVADVEGPEFRRQPGLAPAPEGAVDIGPVPAGEARAQVTADERLAGAADPFEGDVLDEEVRRDQHDPTDARVADPGGVERGDGRPVAVPDQHPAPQADGIQHPRQDVLRFDGMVIGRARQRYRIGPAVTAPAPGEDAAARRDREALGDIAPERDAAEALVQQDQHRCRVRSRSDATPFEAHAVDREKPLVGIGCHHGAGCHRSVLRSGAPNIGARGLPRKTGAGRGLLRRSGGRASAGCGRGTGGAVSAPIAVFAGPSLPPAHRPDDPRFLWLPPVARGDVARLVGARRRPALIAIVDGFFEGVPAVLHKEILWALAEGIAVFGAASMGALRAAELHTFGMIGVGRIFEAYRDGEIVDDDEVAVVHAPAELGYAPLSLAMVDLRATVAAAEARGMLDGPTAEALVAAGRAIFYKQRDWRRVIERAAAAGADPSRLEAFAAGLPGLEVPQKRLDALALVETLRRQEQAPDPPRLPDIGWSEIFARLAGPPWRPRREPVDADPLLRLVLDELRLDPRLFAGLAPRARLAAGALAGDGPPPAAALAERLGLARASAIQAWAREQGLDAADLDRLSAHAARLAACETAVDDAFLEALLAEARLSGLWPAAAARARRKLATCGDPDPDRPPAAALRLWYFETLLGCDLPADPEADARRRGFRDLADFTRALRYEWVYRHGS